MPKEKKINTIEVGDKVIIDMSVIKKDPKHGWRLLNRIGYTIKTPTAGGQIVIDKDNKGTVLTGVKLKAHIVKQIGTISSIEGKTACVDFETQQNFYVQVAELKLVKKFEPYKIIKFTTPDDVILPVKYIFDNYGPSCPDSSKSKRTYTLNGKTFMVYEEGKYIKFYGLTKTHREYIDNVVDYINILATESEVEKSIFRKLNLSKLDTSQYGRLVNGKHIKNISKAFTDVGIKEAYSLPESSINLTRRYHEAVFTEPTICFRFKDETIRASYSNKFKSWVRENLHGSSSFELTDVVGSKIPAVIKEKIINIKHIPSDDIIGQYLPERNLITMWFNPFGYVDFATSKNTSAIKAFYKLLDELVKCLAPLKIKKHNPERIRLAILVRIFDSMAKVQLVHDKKELSQVERNIRDEESNLIMNYRNRNGLINSIEALSNIHERNANDFLTEIEGAKMFPFVKDVLIENNRVIFQFIPTSIKVELQRGSMTNSLRDIYIGPIRISMGIDNFQIGNLEPCRFKETGSVYHYCSHPHATSTQVKGEFAYGSPCFGDGAGSKLIQQLLARNKWGELAHMMWRWVYTWRPGAEYVKSYTWYDDRLCRGLPVKDEKGQLIKINDPKRIKTGEQIKLKKY